MIAALVFPENVKFVIKVMAYQTLNVRSAQVIAFNALSHPFVSSAQTPIFFINLGAFQLARSEHSVPAGRVKVQQF